MGTLVQTEIAAGVATVRMNRAELHNALDDALIAELTEALAAMGRDPAVRVVILAGAGKSFSAGADLDWMRRMAENSYEENLAGARRLAALLRTLHDLPKPTIARVHGAAFGGALGLISACDIAVAADAAIFCLSEVRLGLIPAMISPYVVAAIGPRYARRYFLTAERFDSGEAARIGLVHRVATAEGLDVAIDETVAALLAGGPAAQTAAKRLVADVAGHPLDDALVEETAKRIAEIRATPEGREGVAAFLEKRKPAWAPKG
jgi:methylglutaconyl-CoA hydratase